MNGECAACGKALGSRWAGICYHCGSALCKACWLAHGSSLSRCACGREAKQIELFGGTR